MKLKFERKGKVIKDLEAGTKRDFKTINEAKRESAKLQKTSGGLGCGILRVIS